MVVGYAIDSAEFPEVILVRRIITVPGDNVEAAVILDALEQMA